MQARELEPGPLTGGQRHSLGDGNGQIDWLEDPEDEQQQLVGESLEEPDSLMLLNLIKDEIVNELRLPPSVSAALGPAFQAFEKALKKSNEETGISDLDS